MQNVLALSHIPFEDLGSLGLALNERGAVIDFIDASVADFASLDVVAPELLVILGGPIGAYEVEVYPFLRAEIDFVRRRLDSKLPTLGFCLGAQLIACALGARVYPGSNGKEIGWGPVWSFPDITRDPLIARLIAEAPAMFHFHGDTFDLPKSARLLACSDKYPNQAFAIDDYALGFQFHPEVTADGLERWYVGHACELAASGVDIVSLRKTSRELAPKLEQAALRFWRSWLDQKSL